MLTENDFTEEKTIEGNRLWRYKTGNGREWITVLNRETGWGGGVRDTETGYSSPEGKFWLASGGFDIRCRLPLEFDEVVSLIKENANTCTGL